jgi:hypothetical protein
MRTPAHHPASVTIPFGFRAHLLWEMTSSSEPRASTSRALHREPAVLQPTRDKRRSKPRQLHGKPTKMGHMQDISDRRSPVRTQDLLRSTGTHPIPRKCRFAGLSKR